jgi:hypothetical protein
MSTDHDLEAMKELLPFYVNGTLNEVDRDNLEKALETSAQLRDALEREKALQSRFSDAMDAELDEAGVPRNAQAKQPRQSSEEEDEEEDRLRDALGAFNPDNWVTAVPLNVDVDQFEEEEPSRLEGALSFLNPRKWAPAVTLAIAAAAVGHTAAIASQSGTIADQQERIAQLEADNFALASGQEDCDEQADVVVELDANANWKDAVDLFDGQGLKVIDSNSQGVLSLELLEQGSDLESIVDVLNASELVLSASKVA